jgi:hypothetical protein
MYNCPQNITRKDLYAFYLADDKTQEQKSEVTS